MLPILIVDEDQPSLETLQNCIKFLGYSVVSANTFTEALRVLETLYVDLVIVDLSGCNRMKGSPFAADILRIQPKARIIFLTGDPMGCVPSHACLVKPYLLSDLHQAIETH